MRYRTGLAAKIVPRRTISVEGGTRLRSCRNVRHNCCRWPESCSCHLACRRFLSTHAAGSRIPATLATNQLGRSFSLDAATRRFRTAYRRIATATNKTNVRSNEIPTLTLLGSLRPSSYLTREKKTTVMLMAGSLEFESRTRLTVVVRFAIDRRACCGYTSCWRDATLLHLW